MKHAESKTIIRFALSLALLAALAATALTIKAAHAQPALARPALEARLVYVSPTGDDANTGLAPDQAVRTVERGFALLRDQHPDWLLLQRGHDYELTAEITRPAGASADAMAVIAAWGTGETPELNVGPNSNAFAANQLAADHMLVRGVILNGLANSGATLTPGDGWTGATSQPDPVGSSTRAGYDAKAIARWDVVPYQTFNDEFPIGVVAFHINGIDRVEFAVDGGPWTAVTEITTNPRTLVNEYWVNLDADQFDQDGEIEVRAIVYPKTGIPRVLAGAWDASNSEYGSQWTGQHSLVLHANPQGSLVEEVIELPAGNYTWAKSPLAGVQQHRSRWLTIRPAPGVKKWQVVINDGLQTGNDHIDFRRVRIANLTVRSSGSSIFRHLSGDEWFDNVDYIGPGQVVESQEEQVGDYWTNSRVSDNQFGLARRFVRDCRFERIGEDVMKSVYLVVNSVVDDVDRGSNDWHPGVIANPIKHDNRIYYGLTMRNLKGVKGWAFRQGTLGPYEHTDVAVVNCDSEKSGGNQLWYLGGTVKHLYILNSRFIGSFNYRLSTSVREEWRFKGYNVVYENVNWQDDPDWFPTPYPLTGVTIRQSGN